jgi:hypothetical protein
MSRKGSHITKMCVLAASFALLWSSPDLHAQVSPSPNGEYFPLGIGDYWVYWDYAWGVTGVWDTITVRVLKDSAIAGKACRMTEGHSWRYLNTWQSYYRADTLGNILSVDPTTGTESLKYRLGDTTHTWWDSQPQRFDSSAVKSLYGASRRCLYIGSYNISGADTVLYSTDVLIEHIGFYVRIYNALVDGGPTILAGGSIRGVPFGSVADVRGENATLPVGITLHPPYPNPFNPTATIRYSVSQRCHVHLEIDDILGEQVALLYEGAQEPGAHVVTWDGSGKASGIYLCHLQAGGVTQTQRLLLLR